MHYQIIERDSFQLIGLKENFHCSEEFDQSIAINHFWGQLGEDGTLEILLRLKNGEISGLIGATVNFDEEKNQIEYWVGVESKGAVPDGFSVYHIPASKWIVFEAVGPVREAVPETWEKIYSEWFPTHDFKPSGGPALEVFQSPGPTSSTIKTEIWVPVK